MPNPENPRYDQRALADQGEVEFECWETFEDAGDDARHLCGRSGVEKSKGRCRAYTVRGKRAFLRITTRTGKNRKSAFDYFTPQ